MGQPVDPTGRAVALADRAGDDRCRDPPRRDQEAPAPVAPLSESPAEPQEIPATPAKPADLGLSDRQAQYRIWYEKLAEAAYLSQLEVQSILERALRRTLSLIHI